MPGQIIILNEEYAAEVGHYGYHVFPYFKDTDGTIRQKQGSSMVLPREVVRKLADIDTAMRERDEAETTP